MQPDPIARYVKLRRVARRAEWIALAGSILVPAYALYLGTNRQALLAWLSPDPAAILVPPADPALWLAYALNMVSVAIFAAAMWQARLLFRLLGRARMFDPATSRVLVRLGRLAIAGAVAGVTMRPVTGLLLSSANPPGHSQLVLGIGSDDIIALIAGLLLLAFALVTQEAARIEEENRGFV
jgi:hypothetical protein